MCTFLDLSAAPDDAEQLAESAAASLAPEEIETWNTFRLPKRRREWLMGRIVAKEAVRILMRRDDGPHPPSRREIVVRTDERGRPSVPAMVLSIAHTEGIAVAAVSTRAAGIGIDVERLDRRRGDYEPAAFTEGERRRLDAGPADRRAERALRLFCAKEAAAKATGLGLMGSPHNLDLVACDAGVTRVELRAAGRLAEAVPPEERQKTLVSWVGAGDGLVIGAGTGLVIALSQRDAALSQRDAEARP
ncbi:MAG TPA: 4'-phosphopantetheinyl transferase superfamily protein [Candidatus Polarisedimenticolia bacterium]|nr:4'-phosphopantetheinyl transferase superfamily protein [Candidatus Polarisedimenticolia bacterium]